MFTGIIESLARVKSLQHKGSNLTITLESKIAGELKPDQSLSHNGVCLTVENCEENSYIVTAIDETLAKTNLKQLKEGDYVNIERSLKAETLLDGHIVQGHVDATGICEAISDVDGSHLITISFPANFSPLIVEKGSICMNGISLTAFEVSENRFKVAVIPFTREHTNLKYLQVGDIVNLEFDIIGKYTQKMLKPYLNKI